MTSLFIDPALFEAPSEPEPRDQLIVNGRYMLPPIGDPTGKRRSLQRVTNFIKQLSDTEGLTKWKLRTLVVGMARDERLYDLATSLSPDDKRDLDELIEKAIDLGQAGPSGGNITGTALHNYTDDLPGRYPIRVRDKWVPKVENLFAALHNKGLRAVPGLSERLVVSERYGTCGRLDDVYEDPWGTLRVGDRKSQKEFQTWWEVGAQLALYQGSDAMWNEAECRFEDMPNLADDVAHVAWMPLKHPAAKKGGGDVDQVTIYDIPLAGPREVLDWCLSVRTLRTQARQWGAERVDLDDFARVARDIRDAESHDELLKLAPRVDGDALYEMAAKRWEELAATEEPVHVPSPNELARRDDTVSVTITDSPSFDVDKTTLTVNGTHDAVTKFVAGIDYGVPNAAPVLIPREMLEARPPSAEAIVREALEDSLRGFDPALFVAPEQDATFPVDWALIEQANSAGVAEVPGAGGTAGSVADFECRYEGKWASEHPIDIPGQFHCISPEPRPNPLAAATPEERKELRAQEWSDEDGTLRKPVEWAHRLKLEDFRISADSDGVWCKPMPLKTFRHLYATEIALATVIGDVAREQAHPIATAQFTHSKHADATVVELPEMPSQADVDDLTAVPLKVVREVCTRANNSSSSRGRVRLLNDLGKKYAAHADVLLPGLLAEWLAIDGGPTKSGFVKSTEGSARQPMLATLAGPTTLTDYLATKEMPKSVEVIAETEAASAQVPDRAPVTKMAIGLTEAAQEFVDNLSERQDKLTEVRKAYAGIEPDKHSMLRLIEMAKEAANGAERAKVFHEITRRKAWTGAIAAEINQFYLDNGYAVENFDPYFEAQEETVAPRQAYFHLADTTPEGELVVNDIRLATLAQDAHHPVEHEQAQAEIARRAALPADPDDPTSAADALHLLEGVQDRAALAKFWDGLKAQPWFSDQALQEALLGKMMTLKS